eukprot:gene45-815_t
MSWVSSAAEVAGVAFTLGTEINEHKRANHLHREQIAQGLRIHEQEAQAAKAYHRVEIRQANYQHARELLQSQLQHLEMIDLEKRVALRENMRDEWAQITDSAETVLIVNTLMLGVACAMLIEGDLPEFIATAHPWVPVLYYSLLSMAIWLLVASVRFAMVLRFRVGAIVVKEMRTSIVTGRNNDRCFHTSDTYIRSNMPLEVVPACDHPFSRTYTQPITRRPIQTEVAANVPAFIDEKNGVFGNAGYHAFGCPRRSKEEEDAHHNFSASASSSDQKPRRNSASASQFDFFKNKYSYKGGFSASGKGEDDMEALITAKSNSFSEHSSISGNKSDRNVEKSFSQDIPYLSANSPANSSPRNSNLSPRKPVPIDREPSATTFNETVTSGNNMDIFAPPHRQHLNKLAEENSDKENQENMRRMNSHSVTTTQTIYSSDPFPEADLEDPLPRGHSREYSSQADSDDGIEGDWETRDSSAKKKKRKRRKHWSGILKTDGKSSSGPGVVQGDAEVAPCAGIDQGPKPPGIQKAVKAHTNPALRSLHAAYQEMLESREDEDKDLINHLDMLRATKCDPLSFVSRTFFLYGTITLLLTATIYAVSATQSPLDEFNIPIGLNFVFEGNGPFYPQIPWAGIAFLTNILIGMLIHMIGECLNLKEGAVGNFVKSFIKETDDRLARSHSDYSDFVDNVSPMMIMKVQMFAMHLSTVLFVVLTGLSVTLDIVASVMPLKHLLVTWPVFFFPQRMLVHDDNSVLTIGGLDQLVKVNLDTQIGASLMPFANTSVLADVCQFGDLVVPEFSGAPASLQSTFHGRTIDLNMGSDVIASAFSSAMSDLQHNSILKCSSISDNSNNTTADVWFGGSDSSYIYGSTVKEVNSTNLEFSSLRRWLIPINECEDCKVVDVSVGTGDVSVLVSPRQLVDHEQGGPPRHQIIFLISSDTGAINRKFAVPGRWLGKLLFSLQTMVKWQPSTSKKKDFLNQ